MRRSGSDLAVAGLALALCALVLVQPRVRRTTELSDVSSHVTDGVPIFDWTDTYNVNMFNVACAQVVFFR